MSGIDDFLKEVEADELADKAALSSKLSIAEYAKLRGIEPQRVHYYCRGGRLEKETCPWCGRKVIDVEKADILFGFKEVEADEDEENDEEQ